MSMVTVDATKLNPTQKRLYNKAVDLEEWLSENSYYDSKTSRAVDLLREAIKEYTDE